MFCKYCGSEIPEGARFCAKCGQEATPASEDASLEQENFEQEDFVQEEEYAHGDFYITPICRTACRASIVLGILGVLWLFLGIIAGGGLGGGALLVYSIVFGGLALIFACRYVVGNISYKGKAIWKALNKAGLVLSIIDVAGPIIFFIIYALVS